MWCWELNSKGDLHQIEIVVKTNDNKHSGWGSIHSPNKRMIGWGGCLQRRVCMGFYCCCGRTSPLLSHPKMCVNFVTYLFLIIGIWYLGFSVQFSHIVWFLCPVNMIWSEVYGVFGVNIYTAEMWDHRGIKCVQMSTFIRTGFFFVLSFLRSLSLSLQVFCYYCCFLGFTFQTPMRAKRIYYGALMLYHWWCFFFVFGSKALSFAIFTDMVYPKWVYRMATKDKLNSKSFVFPTSN